MTFESSNAASISSRRQNGDGFKFWIANNNEIAVKAFSPPDNVILEIEVQGAFNIKKQYEDALLIFITAPSAAAIKERLVGRGTESEEVINKRLNRAKEESEDMDKYDYIVINDQVEDCADRIHAIVQAKECLLGNNLKFIEATKKELEQL